MHTPDKPCEDLIVSQGNARNLACKFNNGPDPLPNVPCALLSANHIAEYAKKTGMIAPLFLGGGANSRMKKASYEGRVGRVAYEYNEQGKLVRTQIEKDTEILVVKANSIVFVECDIEFRLPDFIAMRFNLHIRHVHRGLLLGTGPLVDPGYWGRLCIPLHNLTDADYPIPVKKGLIWMEFTKTSHNSDESTERRDLKESAEGRNPNSKKFWEIREFIMRSARQYDIGASVPIRSSIPVAMKEASDTAKKAKSAIRWYNGIGITAILSIGIALAILGHATYSSIWSAHHSVSPQARAADVRSAVNAKDIEHMQEEMRKMERIIRDLRRQIEHPSNQQQ